MFNKLIIAVLTLGLLITFSSAAISSDTPKTGLSRVETSNPAAPKVNQATPIERAAPYNKPAGSLNALSTPMMVLPPDYKCDFLEFSGGNFAYYWKLTDKYGDTIMGMRYTPSEGYNCTLLTAYVAVYGSGIKGNPGMRVEVYDDDGAGFPGVSRGYIDVPAASLPHSGAYWYGVDLTPLGLVYSDGAEFHIGISAVTAGLPSVVDTLAILSDDGSVGTGRSWEYYGAYGTMNDDWGADVNFGLGVDICCDRIPYSSCAWDAYYCNVSYYWRAPHPTYGDQYYSMRFDVEGPETLKTVALAVYKGSTNQGTTPGVDVDVYVLGDDGTGKPNLADVKAHVTVPYASLTFFPGLLVLDMTSLNLVMTSSYYIAFNSNGVPGTSYASCMSDDGSCGTGRSFSYADLGDGPQFYSMLDGWGADFNFLFEVETCKDEFSDCRTLNDFDGDYYYWRYPDRYGDIALYQLFAPKGEGCRIEKINFRFYWRLQMAGWPMYSTNSELQIWTRDPLNNGLPGTKIYSKLITPGNYDEIVPTTASTRWWKTYDINSDNFRFDEEIWVGMESLSPDTLHGFFTLSDAGATGGLRSAEGWGGAYGYMLDDWGIDVDHGIALDVCCVPIGEWPCTPPEDWLAMGQNPQRDLHSGNALGNAACDLTKAWRYDSGGRALFCSPVVYGDTVITCFGDRWEAIDLNTGILIWSRGADGFVVASGTNCTPTVYDGKIYIAGGTSKSFSALDLTNGATVWTRNFAAHSGHFITYGPSVIVDVAGTPLCIYADDIGWVYAVDALTGALYAGWGTNPYKPGQAMQRALSFDGTNVLIGTMASATTGQIIAVDPATGLPVWAWGGNGAVVVPPKDWPGVESFPSPIAVDPINDVFYVNSSYAPADNHDPVQDGGVLYAVTTGGAYVWGVLSNGYTNVGGPAIDAGQVIFQGWCPWLSGGQQRGPHGHARSSGAVIWENTPDASMIPGWGDQYVMEGVLSCEVELPDYYVSVARSNYVHFIQAETGEQLFTRRFSGIRAGLLNRRGHQVAPVLAPGRLILGWSGTLICLTNQDDRPRLELPNLEISVPLEFGSPNPSPVSFPDAIRNTGCTPLVIDSILVMEEDNNTMPWLFTSLRTVSEERLNRLNDVADKYTSKASLLFGGVMDEMNEESKAAVVSSKSFGANAVTTLPAILNDPPVISPVFGSSVAPGVTIPLVLSVNGPLVTRGVHSFYAQFFTSDPDYFLDSAKMDFPTTYLAPEIRLSIVGGCLYTSRRLQFGPSASLNNELIWNSTMLAHGDTASCMNVSGDNATFWQGTLVFGRGPLKAATNPVRQTSFRIALHSEPWDGTDNQWQTILADPNCVNLACSPQLESNILLGTISNDLGATYTQVFGNVMTFAFVDSIQNWDTDTSAAVKWDWAWPQNNPGEVAPFDDTLTIGFKACGKVVGVLNVPLLERFTIHRYAIVSRNNVDIPGFYMGAMIDYDLPTRTTQTNGYDAEHSLGWVYDCGALNNGWGFVKIPYGCRYTPLLMSKTVEARPGGPWNDSAWWLDSAYYWMSVQTGLLHQPPGACAATTTDRDAWFSVAGGTIPANDTLVFAFANFGNPGITNADQASSYFAIADAANKWCGFGRGDVNNDMKIDLVDIVYLANYVRFSGNGPYPFKHLGDVDADGVVGDLDIAFLISYYFNFGECPRGAWTL